MRRKARKRRQTPSGLFISQLRIIHNLNTDFHDTTSQDICESSSFWLNGLLAMLRQAHFGVAVTGFRLREGKISLIRSQVKVGASGRR